MVSVTLEFGPSFSGTAKGQSGEVGIGMEPGRMRPYELLAGALGSCYYSTFLDIAEKMRLSFKSCDIRVEIEKREEVPTMAKRVFVEAKVTGADAGDKAKFERGFELAAKYCSIYQTLSKVAEMTWTCDLVSSEG